VVVLASCNSAIAQVVSGDELLGLAAALLAQEAGAVIASRAPLVDKASVGLMVDLHTALARGTAPSEALAAAQGPRWRERGADFLAAAAITHLGGDPQPAGPRRTLSA
jgi:CHAT domain-containing protein